MEDDASVKQCLVILALARELAERDSDLAELYGFAGDVAPIGSEA
jgi:malyl-CoA/(S)-citramalyl-CoA lyase